MAGEDLDRVWQNLRYWKGDAVTKIPAGLSRYGAGCSAQGCHHCTSTDCPYADFIRRYWNHPHCD